jgi:Lon protease-like protein
MASNLSYTAPGELPGVIPVFPLGGVLLLPRTELPLNIFEPRYLAMVDDVLKGHRIIGMIQPQPDHARDEHHPPLVEIGCAGRLTAFQETGDGRCLITLTGIARYRVLEELATTTPYRQCRIDFGAFPSDYVPRAGEGEVDRPAILRTLRAYLQAHDLEMDWNSIRAAPAEVLVNALAMMTPYGPREKQAMLEAPDLRTRAEILIAVTEMESRSQGEDGEPTLQ